MTLSKPPALATWMLEHLVFGVDNDALAGDLLEEFGHRRSAGWYWRQVLMAIFVGFSKELGRQWRAAVFALAWNYASVIALRVLYQNSQFHSIFGWSLRHDWPESGILTTTIQVFPQILMWWLGLGLHLTMMRAFSARRFARGVLISLFCMLLAFGALLSIWRIVMRMMAQQASWFVSQIPLFLALLLSLCATLPSRAIKRTARIRISE